MRAIKFRGKSIKDGKWIYGDLIHCQDDAVLIFPIDSNEKSLSSEHGVFRHTVGQFTGQYDKNGKEIYEDDIVSYYDNYYGKNYDCVIEFDEYLFIMKVINGSSSYYFIGDSENIEVTGNRFDNHKL